jgi:hypothetical protein
MPAATEKGQRRERREVKLHPEINIRLDLFAKVRRKDAWEIVEEILDAQLPPIPEEYRAALAS